MNKLSNFLSSVLLWTVLVLIMCKIFTNNLVKDYVFLWMIVVPFLGMLAIYKNTLEIQLFVIPMI